MRILEQEALVGAAPSSRISNSNLSALYESANLSNELAQNLNGNSADSRRNSALYEFIKSGEDASLTTPSGQQLSSIFSENCNNVLSTDSYTSLGSLFNNLNQLSNTQLASHLKSELNLNLKRIDEAANSFPGHHSEAENKLQNFKHTLPARIADANCEQPNQVKELQRVNANIVKRELSREISIEEGALNETSMDGDCDISQVDRDLDNGSVELTPEDSLLEDEEVFLQSSVSSCSSISSPGKSNFPRGIINPNYPGFQHLAHTLSEHFASHGSSDPYDSDFSEYEMELSVDSFDDSIGSHNNNNHADNNNDDDFAVDDLDDQNCPDIKVIPYESDTCDLDKDSCNLETYLKKFATSADVKLQHMDEGEDDIGRDGPTPDILVKNNKNSVSRKPIAENRPDLLRNVSPNLKDASESSSPVPSNIRIKSKPEIVPKDDVSLGITPVDIVGDFGKEVELEFGLLVTGYKTNSLYKEASELTEAQVKEEFDSMSKMLDAVLSDGIETLTSEKLLSLQYAREDIPCDLVLEATAVEAPSELEHTQNSESPVPVTHMRSSSVRGSKNSPPENLTDVDNASNIDKPDQVEKTIPTAIVKPKYQRYSFDDRQLAPVGMDFHTQSSAWYENKENSSSHSHHSRKSHCPDRTKKITHRNSSECGSGSGPSVVRFPQSRRSDDKKSESSAVAIVTPRKKDKSELHSKKINKTLCEKNNNAMADSNGHLPSCDKMNNNAKKNKDMTSSACFDVYNIETALPVIDLVAIESHLKKAKEEERKRRNDREEIRRRLAMGAEDDYFSKLVTNGDRPGRKPSLQSRIQNGKNLQICFMNEASSDTDTPSSDSETCPKLSKVTRSTSNMSKFSFGSDETDANPYSSRPLSVSCTNGNLRKTLSSRPSTLQLGPPISEDPESDFFTKQARLQIEARMALAQAKDMAHMQMEIDKQKQKQSPITEVIRNSLEKVGVPLPPEKRRVSRQMLTDMNIAQLQIIVNDLHTQIEFLNTHLVQFLMERDDLHMGQDSMLVDIEDLTRYLGAKEQSKANEKAKAFNTYHDDEPTNDENCERNIGNNIFLQKSQPQSKLQRIASLVKK